MTNGIQGLVAPDLLVSHWIDETGRPRTPLTLNDLGSRHRILFFYQHWCPGCHSHGFPTLLELIEHAAPLDVGFAVVQTVFEGFDVNTADQLRLDQQRYELHVPFGHDPISPDGQYPKTMVNYRTGGTPWFVAIDPEGTVIENGFSVDVNKLLSIFRKRS
ncbi:peroxiredoxin family protein [Devosia nitrariae]|uniref:peroxiredoxin family protein n=1 Tax=Devosia nitrariae TaxID=2071872 RepID=UPI0024E12E1E|nr:TlpA family protein disulfide reductase [Devosia nitrariae]